MLLSDDIFARVSMMNRSVVVDFSTFVTPSMCVPLLLRSYGCCCHRAHFMIK